MKLPRIAPFIAPLITTTALLAFAPATYALDENGAKKVIDNFFRSQKLDQQASPSESQHVIADLNGDGKLDLVLMWDVMGPTWSLPKLTLFIDTGKNYRTLTTDLTGQTEKLTVRGANILIDAKTLGPNDARCCPTKKVQQRYQWTQNKLVMLK